jgi:ferric-dicitrate binding protein FerR (iron transport regulator)
MNSNPDPGEERLNQALREWRVAAPLPPRFQEQVWRKIEQAAPAPAANPWSQLLALFDQLLARRRLAYSYLTAALVLGLALGWWQASEQNSTVNTDLSRRYVQSVDPYLKPGHL